MLLGLFMKIGFIFAMQEEAVVLKHIFGEPTKVYDHPFFEVSEYSYKDVKVVAVVSGIGKAFAASATTLLIEKFDVNFIVNIGSAGGVNSKVGDIILSQSALYHDVDVTAAGYVKGVLPKQPLIFESPSGMLKLDNVIKKLANKEDICIGTVATGDQFINDINIVNKIKDSCSNIKAIEMEAAAIAQICHNYSKQFLLVKKISDLADSEASESFNKEITNFNDKISDLIKILLSFTQQD